MMNGDRSAVAIGIRVKPFRQNCRFVLICMVFFLYNDNPSGLLGEHGETSSTFSRKFAITSEACPE